MQFQNTRRSRLRDKFHFEKLEELISSRKRITFTMLSYVLIFVIFLNLTSVHLIQVGTVAFLTYFLINGIFWGYALFEEENTFLRLIHCFS